MRQHNLITTYAGTVCKFLFLFFPYKEWNIRKVNGLREIQNKIIQWKIVWEKSAKRVEKIHVFLPWDEKKKKIIHESYSKNLCMGNLTGKKKLRNLRATHLLPPTPSLHNFSNGPSWCNIFQERLQINVAIVVAKVFVTTNTLHAWPAYNANQQVPI